MCVCIHYDIRGITLFFPDTCSQDLNDVTPPKIDEVSLLSFVDGDLLQDNPADLFSTGDTPPTSDINEGSSLTSSKGTDEQLNSTTDIVTNTNDSTGQAEIPIETKQDIELSGGGSQAERSRDDNDIDTQQSPNQQSNKMTDDNKELSGVNEKDKSSETIFVEVEDTPLFVDDTLNYFSDEDKPRTSTSSMARPSVSPTPGTINSHSEVTCDSRSHADVGTTNSHSEGAVSTQSHDTIGNRTTDDAANGVHCTGTSSLVSSYNGGSSSLSVSGEASPLSSSPTAAYGSSFPYQMKRNQSGKRVPVVPPRPQILKSASLISGSSTMSTDSSIDDTISRISTFSTASSTLSDDHTYTNHESSIASVILPRSPSPPVAPATIHKAKAEQAAAEDNYTCIIHFFSTIALYLYYSFNPFVYLAGFIAGFLIFYLITGSAFVLYVQQSEREKARRKESHKHDTFVPLDDLPPTINTDFESNRVLEV